MKRVELKKCPVNGGLISSCLPFKAQWLRRLTVCLMLVKKLPVHILSSCSYKVNYSEFGGFYVKIICHLPSSFQLKSCRYDT